MADTCAARVDERGGLQLDEVRAVPQRRESSSAAAARAGTSPSAINAVPAPWKVETRPRFAATQSSAKALTVAISWTIQAVRHPRGGDGARKA